MITKPPAVNPQNDSGAIQALFPATIAGLVGNLRKYAPPNPRTVLNGPYAADVPLHARPHSPEYLGEP